MRLRLRQLAADGATDEQILAYDSTTDRWRPVTGQDAAALLAAHTAAADPHTGYQRESEKGVANGYASLDGDGLVPESQLPPSASGAHQYYDDVLTAAGGETAITLGQTPIARSERIWHNQTLLDRGVGYTISGNSVTLLVTLAAGDEVRDYYAFLAGLTPTAAVFAGAGYDFAVYDTAVYS